MSLDWAEKTAQQLLNRDLIKTGICLLLGASDTGKTTLAEALAKHLVLNQPACLERPVVSEVEPSRKIGIVDADIGQSHIGPPTTVGWALVENPQVDFSKLTAGGISFVGNITPVGHLLQLTSAIIQCVQQLSSLTELIIIDTPGLITGSAACALWWTVQHILKPRLILAVQRNDELNDILAGLRSLDSKIELIKSPPEIRIKSPQQRQRYRQNQFEKYFRDSCLYNISLTNMSVQSSQRLSLPAEALAKAGRDALTNRPFYARHSGPVRRSFSEGGLRDGGLVGLRDAQGVDLAIGIINDWQDDKDNVVVRAPRLDVKQIRCLVIGDATIGPH